MSKPATELGMNVIKLKVEPMTREAFAPFGVLLDTRGVVTIDVGDGMTSMTGATSEWRPFTFNFMARHLRTMQVFSPLASSRAVIAVAPPSIEPKPRIDQIRAFITDGRLPYAYHKGTWHTAPFPVGDWASYLVVDRSGTLDDDWHLVDLRSTDNVSFEIEL
jgi:ureidoglycolate lyase